jgi:hypothetical protein
LGADCTTIREFDAAAGRAYVIRLGIDGSASVDEVSAVDAGPSLGEGPPLPCELGAGSDDLPLVVVGIGFVAVLVVSLLVLIGISARAGRET